MLAGLDAIGGFVIGGATGGSFTVSVSPSGVFKSGGSKGADRTLTTAVVTVTAAGGAGGYTYSWSRIGGDASITADTPTAAATHFSATLSVGDSISALFVCTVTDAAAAVLTTDTVTVTMSLEDFSGVGGSL